MLWSAARRLLPQVTGVRLGVRGVLQGAWEMVLTRVMTTDAKHSAKNYR